jgi:hypothetical protein
VCYVEASYGGLLPIGEHRSITGIIICLGGTAIFAKTRIQRTTSLSSIEAEIIAGCDAGKDIKYFCKLFVDLGFPITKPTLVAEDSAGSILIANHRRPSGRTRNLYLQYFATHEWVQRGLVFFYKIEGTANPSDAMSKVLYRILHRRHFERIMGYNGSTHPPTPPIPRSSPTLTATPVTFDCWVPSSLHLLFSFLHLSYTSFQIWIFHPLFTMPTFTYSVHIGGARR